MNFKKSFFHLFLYFVSLFTVPVSAGTSTFIVMLYWQWFLLLVQAVISIYSKSLLLKGHRSDWRQVGVICSEVYAVILCIIKMPVSPVCHTVLCVHNFSPSSPLIFLTLFCISFSSSPLSFILLLLSSSVSTSSSLSLFFFLSFPFPPPVSLTQNVSLCAHAPWPNQPAYSCCTEVSLYFSAIIFLWSRLSMTCPRQHYAVPPSLYFHTLLPQHTRIHIHVHTHIYTQTYCCMCVFCLCQHGCLGV